MSQRLSPGANEPPDQVTKSRTRTPIPPNSAERHIVGGGRSPITEDVDGRRKFTHTGTVADKSSGLRGYSVLTHQHLLPVSEQPAGPVGQRRCSVNSCVLLKAEREGTAHRRTQARAWKNAADCPRHVVA